MIKNAMTMDEYKQMQNMQTGAGPSKDAKRQAQGYKSRAVGKTFESWISVACAHYEEQGIAYIEKTPEPMSPIKRLDAGRFVAVFTEKAQCDYKGTLNGGRAIAFEAKHTDNDKIKQSAVTEKQKTGLDKHEAMGAKCFVAVSIGLSKFYRVPWKIWKAMKEIYGHKHMTVEELKPYQIPQRGFMVMFLEGIE